MSTTATLSNAEIITGLRDAVAGWRPTFRAIPAVLRADCEAALTRVLVSRPDREDYLAALGRLNAPPDGNTPDFSEIEVPVETLSGEGFTGLADEHVAAVGLQPHVIRLVAQWIDEQAAGGALGEVWWAAIERAGETAYPADPSPDFERRVSAVLPTAPPDIVASPRPVRPRRRVLETAVTIAASLAVGIAVGAVLFRGDRKEEDRLVLALSAAPVLAQAQGPGEVFDLKVGSERPGFVTVVVVRPDGQVTVRPSSGADEIRVAAGETRSVARIDAHPGDAVLAVVTETPAGHAVRTAVDSLPPGTSSDQLRQIVVSALWANGYRWAAIACPEVK